MEDSNLSNNISNKNYDENNNKIYSNYSVSFNEIPKNFVPIIKPKKIIFGNEEDIIPFSLQNESTKENNYNNDNNNKYFYPHIYCSKIINSNSFVKKKKNTILSKLIEKKKLSLLTIF
jgi:hypothetical protein